MGSLYLAYTVIDQFVQGKTLPDVVFKVDEFLGIDISTCLVHGEEFSVADFRKLIQDSFGDAERLLSELTYGFNCDAYLEDKIFEDSANSDDGYCWLYDNRNTKLREGIDEFLKDFDTRPELFTGRGEKVFNRVEAAKWLEKAEELLKNILFLFHATPGQSGRASENVKILIVNMIKCRRSILFHHKQMIIQPTNLKPESATQKLKKVLRFPCKRLSRLLVVYLAFVRPVEA